MDKLETKTESGSDIGDPSTPFVAGAIVMEATRSTVLSDEGIHQEGESKAPIVQYRLYRRRWWGIVALVRALLRERGVDDISSQVILNIVKGMNWVWFGAIANATTKEFNITLDEVNWFANAPHLSYLVFSWCVPILVRRFGLRNTVRLFCSRYVPLNLSTLAVSLRHCHSRPSFMDTSMRNDPVLVIKRLFCSYPGGSAPRGHRCPVFPSRWTEICGSLVRSEGESHSDHDCSHLYVLFIYFGISLRILLAYLCLQLTHLGRRSAKSYHHS
jgi:hypothetical protein